MPLGYLQLQQILELPAPLQDVSEPAPTVMAVYPAMAACTALWLNMEQ